MRYLAKLIRIKDGDTFQVLREAGCGIKQELVIRLARVNCPEVPSSEGMRAKHFVEAKFSAAKLIEIEPLKLDKYGRTLANVFLDGDDLSDTLLGLSLAERYVSSMEWCWLDDPLI